MFRKITGIALVGVLALGVGADVVTNVWINPAGGYWADTNNWQNGNVAISTTVADFRQLASGSKVTITNYTCVGGMVFSGGADDVWTLETTSEAKLSFRTDLFGCTPICVEGGTLQLDCLVEFSGVHIARKEGNGILVTKHDFPSSIEFNNQMIVAEGIFRPKGMTDLWQANVHVTGTGVLDVPDSLTALWLGSYSSDNGATVDLKGRRFLFGASCGAMLSENVVGTGQLVSVAGNVLSVANPQPGVEYVAREGVVKLGDLSVVGHWEFDDPANPGKDSGTAGNDLAVSNSVTVVDDAERGKVALFGAESCLFGTGPGRSIKFMPVGNSSYTVAAWVKAGASTPWGSALFFWGPLPVVNYTGLLCRFNGTQDTGVYAGHGGSGLWNDYESRGFSDGTWHHFAVSYDGKSKKLGLYYDGVFRTNLTYTVANAATAENFSIGFPWSVATTYPNGLRMDDAILLNRCLSADEVSALKDGTFATEPSALPAGVGLSATYNGEICLAGDQTIAEIGGDSVRGGVAMPIGGTLTVTGSAEKVTTVYAADVGGAASFVKDGAATRLILTGPLSYTGSTRVKAGTLALGAPDAPFAAYDFEDENLGIDSSGNGRTLAVAGATRVWDEARGGWVARFVAASKQDLNGEVGSTAEMYGNSDYTLSVWAKPSASCPSQASFLSFGKKNDTAYQEIQFRFQDFSTRKLVLAHWGSSHDFTGIPSTSASPVGEWHHYVAVREGATYRVYVDGEQTWSTTKAGAMNFQADSRLHIGSFFGTIANNAQRYFDGDMDDVRIYGHALDADAVKMLYARAKPQMKLPEPVLHYAFEDAANPGKDSSGNGCDLTATGTLTCENSPLGGKALTFDASALSYLSASPLPTTIPAAGEPMTVTFWLQNGAKDAASGATYPTFVSWGDPGTGAIDFMIAYRYDLPWRPRLYMKKSDNNAIDHGTNKDILLYPSAPDELRWHHFAIVYDPAKGITTYADGQTVGTCSQAGAFTNVRTADGTFYLGVKPTNLTHPFRGRLDEVKVYAAALTRTQVRAALRAEQMQNQRILPVGTPLTVDAGAKLSVEAGEQTVSSLAGGGTVAIATNACLTTSDIAGFTGSVTGAGTLGIADGTVLDFGDGTSPVLTAEGTIALGADVTVNATFTGGTYTLMRAGSFEGVENLASWSDSPKVKFFVSSDGKSLQMSIFSGTTIIFR